MVTHSLGTVRGLKILVSGAREIKLNLILQDATVASYNSISGGNWPFLPRRNRVPFVVNITFFSFPVRAKYTHVRGGHEENSSPINPGFRGTVAQK
jgi:hypothetical protein